jgi:hypothetical protein
LSTALQVAPQSMPAGALVTLPLPDFATDRAKLPVVIDRSAARARS